MSEKQTTPLPSIDERMQFHDAAHGTYYPGPCEECASLGWLNSNGRYIPDEPQRPPWRARPYALTIFGHDDKLVTVVELTEDQADKIGRACWSDDTDGVGEYPVQYVYLSPQNGE